MGGERSKGRHPDSEMSHTLVLPKEFAETQRHRHALLNPKVEKCKYHNKCKVKVHISVLCVCGCVGGGSEMNSRQKKKLQN